MLLAEPQTSQMRKAKHGTPSLLALPTCCMGFDEQLGIMQLSAYWFHTASAPPHFCQIAFLQHAQPGPCFDQQASRLHRVPASSMAGCGAAATSVLPQPAPVD